MLPLQVRTPSMSGPSGRPSGSKHHSRTKSLSEPADILKQLQRQLLKHAHSTSSQFALIICDSKGNMQLPIPSTSAFQGYLDKWIPDSVRQEAGRVAVSAADEKKVRRRRDSSNIGKDIRHHEQRAPLPADMDDDDEGEWPMHEKTMDPATKYLMSNAPPDLEDTEMHMKKRPSQDDSAVSRKRKSVPRPEPLRRDSSSGSDEYVADGGAEYIPLIIGDEEAVTTFYMTRLRQMQQLMCKVVAKAWIKVIEPKKQSNFPYNRGNETKPLWWPDNVRHKEPDHLMKPERLELLLTMLRCGKVPISKLVVATSEVMVQIPKERIPLLEEIYMVAEKEERCKAGALSPETAVYIASSPEKMMNRTSNSTNQKPRSPKDRRQSLASPLHTPAIDRRLSIQSTAPSDLADTRDLDRREDPITLHHSAQAFNNPSVDYYPPPPPPEQHSQHGQNAQIYHDSNLALRNPMEQYHYVMNSQPQMASQPPVLRRHNTVPMPQTSGPQHHTWATATQIASLPPGTMPGTNMPGNMQGVPGLSGMFPPYSPGGSTPSYGSGSHGQRGSASNPGTPVGGTFHAQGMQLPPPGHQQQHQQHPLPGTLPQTLPGTMPGSLSGTLQQRGGGYHEGHGLRYTEFLGSDLGPEDEREQKME